MPLDAALGLVRAEPAQVLDHPVVLVDLDQPPGPTGLAGLAELRRSVVLLVGVATGPLGPAALGLARHLDFSLAPTAGSLDRAIVARPDPSADAEAIVAAAERAPRAAAILASVIRDGALAPVPVALGLEAAAFSTLLGGPEFARWLAAREAQSARKTQSPRTARPAPTERGEPILVERDGDILRIVLSQPERRNAFTRSLRDALVDALELAVLEPAVRVELTGAGPVFSSGGDLDEFGTTPDPATAWVARMSRHPGRLLHELRDRASVRLQGRCAGAGVEMPLFAGRVTAAPDTTLRLPELGMGLIPGAGGTVSITARAGRWRACWLALSGTELPVDEALRWGLVDAVN